MISSRILRLALLGAIVGSLCVPSLVHAQSAHQSPPNWATYNAKKHVAHLLVISSYGSDTYNFNGGSSGAFTFTVPLGATVDVTYSNDSPMMPHGFEVVKWTGTLPDTAVSVPKPAFKGAASPNYKHGTMTGITQKFSFVANKAGKYLMICPVRNHVKFGHWGWFIVSKTAKKARGVLKASS